jgi:DNA-binding NtrC family response regulator
VSARSVLVVDDHDAIRLSIARYFRNHAFEVGEAATIAEAVEAFQASRPDAAILDYSLPDGTALDLMRTLRGIDESVPVVILTAHGSIDLAVKAIQDGADHFLTKPVELAALKLIVERTLEHQRNRQARQAGRTRSARRAVDPFQGDSPAIRRAAQQAERVAASGSPILIQGETGTGKGVLARWIHEHGPRSEESFVDLNCAGLAREFLETELFGHEKGAFTGAVASKPGLLEMAHRGTLFLDEIGDLDPVVQPKLLKVLEEQRFRRLGDVRDRQVNVRLVAASHRSLEEMAERQQFRRDLLYRINAITLHLPALRERADDVLLLARSLLERIGSELGRSGLRLDASGEEALLAHPWPGNVRELRNVLERAVLLSASEALGAADLQLSRRQPATREPSDAALLSLEEAERRHIALVLDAHGGDVNRAAAVLGVARSTLYKKIKAVSAVVKGPGARG